MPETIGKECLQIFKEIRSELAEIKRLTQTTSTKSDIELVRRDIALLGEKLLAPSEQAQLHSTGKTKKGSFFGLGPRPTTTK